MSTQTTTEYREVIRTCQHVLKKKCADYGTSWRIMRLPSFTDQIFIKAKRIYTIQEKKKQINEGIKTELIGIINYSVLALIQMKLKQDPRMAIPCDEVGAAYDRCIKETMGLMAQKNHDYDEVWREMRVSSIVDIILMKLLRIKQIEDNQGHSSMSEGVASGYQDIINYAVFASIQLAASEKKRSMKNKHASQQTLGKRGEHMGIKHLKAQHFTIIATNKRIGRSEIDIIAQREGILVFVEVKLRSNDAFGTPESFVTPAQAARYHEAATAYIEEIRWTGPIRFDVIALEKKGQKTILQHFEDAF